MKNEKNQKNERSPKSSDQPAVKQQRSKKAGQQGMLETGRGSNKNDDPSEDSKGGNNLGLGHQEGANQGHYQGGGGKGGPR